MGKKEKIVILDFGGQYNQLIARRIRDLHVYSEVLPFATPLEELADPSVIGIIFTGGPNSVYLASSPHIGKEIFELKKPILSICYGAQLIAYSLGGKVKAGLAKEYGNTLISLKNESLLFAGVPTENDVYMSHGDIVEELPNGFTLTASSDSAPNAAFEDERRKIYAVQFHPEVKHTVYGQTILDNFVSKICHAKKDWEAHSFVAESIEKIRKQVGEGRVLCALSGGVDSAVTSALLDKAIGDRLTCVFVDHGLLRKNEAEQVKAVFGDRSRFHLNFVPVDASDLFLERLKDVTDPEQKRKIIGKTFIDVFEKTKENLPECEYLAQGTIYPDRIESGIGCSATIKSHHNVGGLPKNISFKGLIEPLADLFKDEVRVIGLELGLPKEMVYRQPFPGPGLGVRIVGEITREKIAIVQEADYIFRQELEKSGLAKEAAQYFAALTNMRSVGVKGDGRSYDYAISLRAVKTDDFMTAEPVELPFSLIRKISDRIVNEVNGVNRVLYDYTSKPPATIELE